MVCKFAYNGCELYDPDLHAATCEVQNGGPFTVSGKAYCGRYRILESKNNAVVLECSQ